MPKEPLKVGVLVGREWSWPPAFIDEVNRRNEGVTAEFVKLGGTQMNELIQYRVIVDRISHEVPYYRSYLKNAALQGVAVINDPFMWTADDKFFGASLATQLGVASPKTVVLPNKDYVQGIVHEESLRNLVYPLDWEEIVRYIGLPAVLKDAHGGGWRDVYIVHNMEDLWARYNQSGTLTMILQEFIHWDGYARCMCLGQEEVYVMDYDPRARKYDDPHFAPELHNHIVADSLKLVRALGYDMNTVEFAIRDGIPYAIDFMNPAPDMDVNSLGKTHFDWMVTHMADLVIRLAKSNAGTQDRYGWAKTVRDVQQAAQPVRRPRGRPPGSGKKGKLIAASATPVAASESPVKARRGRKPRVVIVNPAPVSTSEAPGKARRGRKPRAVTVNPAQIAASEAPGKARRGRKPRAATVNPVPTPTAKAPVSPTGKRRGRPPKVRPETPAESSESGS